MSKSLIREYSDDIKNCLTNWSCSRWLSVPRSELAVKSVKDLAEFILITHSESSSSFPDNHCLFTLSDTSCDSCQRWKKFSKLKLINTFLCSTIMSQVRLSSLAIYCQSRANAWMTWTLTRLSILLLITKPARSHSRIKQWRYNLNSSIWIVFLLQSRNIVSLDFSVLCYWQDKRKWLRAFSGFGQFGGLGCPSGTDITFTFLGGA